jgi:HJR/Mrr/RecB family endonuclease
MYFILGVICAFIILCWIGSEWIIRSNYKDSHDSKKYSTNRQLKLLSDAIDGLDGFQFEEFISKMFNLGGMKAKVTPKTRDGGKDVIIKDKGKITYIECKHYAEENKITVNYIHKLISACVIDNVSNGIFITTSNYSKESIAIAKKCKAVNIDIWYKDDVLEFCKGINMLELLDWLGYNRDEVLKYCMI